MYMLYLVSALSLFLGVGTFITYDTYATQTDVSAAQKEIVSQDVQNIISRRLRNLYYIDPASFPVAAPGSYVQIPTSLIQQVLIDGTQLTGMSTYWMDSQGNIFGLVDSGASSPSSGTGDTTVGFSGLPQYATDLISYVYGSNVTRGLKTTTTSSLSTAAASLSPTKAANLVQIANLKQVVVPQAAAASTTTQSLTLNP